MSAHTVSPVREWPGRPRLRLPSLRSRVVSIADLVHAAADERDRQAGLTVTRAGLTRRSVRSPLFDARSAQ